MTIPILVSVPFRGRCLVALELESGWVAGSVRHALVFVDEETVGLVGDLLLKNHAVVLQILQYVLAVVHLLHECVNHAHAQLVHFSHKTVNKISFHAHSFLAKILLHRRM